MNNSELNIKGDDLCWIDFANISDKIPPEKEFLESCRRFHSQISGQNGVLNGCKTIAELEKENLKLRELLNNFVTCMEKILEN